MTEAKFRIFKKNKKLVISRTFIVLGALTLSILILLINQNYFRNDTVSSIFQFTGIISAIIMIILSFTRNFEKKKLNGEFTGFIKLFSDKINLNNADYFLDEIEKIEFKLSDYNNEFEISYAANMDPAIIKGVNNQILIYFKNKKIRQEFFQIESKSDFANNAENALTEYHRNGKISFSELTEYLGIEDSLDKQRLKSKINT